MLYHHMTDYMAIINSTLLQVKDFGRAGRTKYTHLVDQDTTVVSTCTCTCIMVIQYLTLLSLHTMRVATCTF